MLMKTPEPRIVRDLIAVRDRLDQGWCQGSFERFGALGTKSGVCLMRAIAICVDESRQEIVGQTLGFPSTADAVNFNDGASNYDVVRSHIERVIARERALTPAYA
jgi:hypothetical protein